MQGAADQFNVRGTSGSEGASAATAKRIRPNCRPSPVAMLTRHSPGLGLLFTE